MTNSLPDYYPTVAEDVIAFCGDQGGRVWVDLGAGLGGLGLGLMEYIHESVIALMDPNPRVLRQALESAKERGTLSRTIAIVGSAELPTFKVIGEGGLTADDPNTGIGIWLQISKETDNG